MSYDRHPQKACMESDEKFTLQTNNQMGLNKKNNIQKYEA